MQRQQLLEGGLQDRSDEVRKAVVAMTAGWLNMDMKDTEETSQVGIEWLLRCLDVENDGESAARMVIQELYKAQLLQLPKLDLCELSSETALMWRVMCELWKEHKVFLKSHPFYMIAHAVAGLTVGMPPGAITLVPSDSAAPDFVQQICRATADPIDQICRSS